MASANIPAPRSLTFADRLRVPRSRGVVVGVLLVLLGIWGGIIPFVGPIFGYSYTPAAAWNFTLGRLWLEILPAAAVIAGGLCLLLTANRAVMQFGGWLAALAGAWFVVGPVLSMLWNGTPAAGAPGATEITASVVEQIGFFIGLGVVVVFLAAFALGRASVIGFKDVPRTENHLPRFPTAP